MRFIFYIYSFLFIFIHGIISTHANEETVDALIKQIKRGDYKEQLYAAKELEKLGLEAKDAKTTLRK